MRFLLLFYRDSCLACDTFCLVLFITEETIKRVLIKELKMRMWDCHELKSEQKIRDSGYLTSVMPTLLSALHFIFKDGLGSKSPLMIQHQCKRGTYTRIAGVPAGVLPLLGFYCRNIACVQTSPISFHPRVEGNRRRLHAGYRNKDLINCSQ